MDEVQNGDKMELDNIIGGIVTLFIIIVGAVLITAISDATGANITFAIIAFFILAIGAIASILKGL